MVNLWIIVPLFISGILIQTFPIKIMECITIVLENTKDISYIVALKAFHTIYFLYAYSILYVSSVGIIKTIQSYYA